MAVTLKNLAEATGLSKQTVSFILGEKAHLFRPETRERVLEAARKLGYRRNASAVAMNKGRCGAIGLMMSTDIGQAVIPFDGLWAIEQALAELDLHLTMGQVPDHRLSDQTELPKILREWSVDGLLVSYTSKYPQALIELLKQYNVPSIWMNAKLAGDCVHPDDLAGAREATEHLMALGHRRIAYASLVPHGHYSLIDRRDGYTQAMRAADLSPQYVEVTHAEFGQVNAGDVARAALSAADRPTAFVGNDNSEATTLIAVAWQLGLRVPEDVSVIVTGNGEADIAGLKYTSNRIPFGEMGRRAVELVMRKIENPTEVLAPVAVPFTLSPGQTTAPPPSLQQ